MRQPTPTFAIYDNSSDSFVGMVVAVHFRLSETERCPSVRYRASRNCHGFWLDDAAVNFAEEYLSPRLALVSDYAEIANLPCKFFLWNIASWNFSAFAHGNA
jgi:hypothetical protein